MSQLFNVPGDSLLDPLEASHFRDLKAAVDKATTDLIIRPDWEANLEVCDLVNATLSDRILGELMFLLRRKLGSINTPLNPVSPTQVMLTLNLVEALVKNGGRKLHQAVNDATFMQEMGNVARRYVNKPGKESNDLAELALDIIQAWGEGFLTRRRQFINIVDTYHTLRKERLPFRAQYDASRVPIFTPSEGDGGMGTGDNTDAILRSMAGGDNDNNSGSGGSGVTRGSLVDERPGELNTGNPVIDAVDTSSVILADMILATENTTEVINNEIVDEMALQLKTSQPMIAQEIEMLMQGQSFDERKSAALFKVNDSLTTVLGVYDGLKEGKISHGDALSVLAPFRSAGNDSPGKDESAPQEEQQQQQDTGDLLGFDDSPRKEAAPATAPVAVADTSSNASFEVDFGGFGSDGGGNACSVPVVAAANAANADPFGGRNSSSEGPPAFAIKTAADGGDANGAGAARKLAPLAPPPGGTVTGAGGLLPSPPKGATAASSSAGGDGSNNSGGSAGGDDLMAFLGSASASAPVPAPLPTMQQQAFNAMNAGGMGQQQVPPAAQMPMQTQEETRERKLSTKELVQHYETLTSPHRSSTSDSNGSLASQQQRSSLVNDMAMLHGQPFVQADGNGNGDGGDPLADLMSASDLSGGAIPPAAPAPAPAQSNTNPFDLF